MKSKAWPEPFRSRASEAFKNADYYGPKSRFSRLHHTDPIEALNEAVDQYCTPHCDVSEVIHDQAPFTIKAYRRKQITSKDITDWAERAMDFIAELFGEEFGDPDSFHYEEIDEKALENAKPKFKEAITLFLKDSNVWACDEVAQITLEAEEVEPLINDLKMRLVADEDPDGVEFMTLNDFIENVKIGAYVDDDGIGDYATETHISQKAAVPSEILEGIIDHSFTHVAWYNK